MHWPFLAGYFLATTLWLSILESDRGAACCAAAFAVAAFAAVFGPRNNAPLPPAPSGKPAEEDEGDDHADGWSEITCPECGTENVTHEDDPPETCWRCGETLTG